MTETGEEQPKEQNNVQPLGWRLMRLAEEQVRIRQMVEERWLEDLERYNGEYDAETLSRLQQSGGSQAFVNIVRSKTNAAESRLSEMLFPTDDRNYGIQPTPKPELASRNDDEANAIKELSAMAAKAMEDEIDDQLIESHYHAVGRDAIHYGCLLGIGIIKGPVVINRYKKSWQQLSGATYALSMQEEFKPAVEHVKPWDFFPDMSATDMENCGFVFERRFLSKKALRDLAKRPGYLSDEIRGCIKEGPMRSINPGAHIARIRELSGVQTNIDEGKYEVWEYSGPVTAEDLRTVGVEIEDGDEMQAVVVMVNNRVIKADLNPLETGELPYSVFIYERDDTSIFGFGVPYLLRNEQRIANSAWRMMLDNATASVRDMMIVNRELVEPADGNWKFASGKTWWLNDPSADVNKAFKSVPIPNHQEKLAAIYEMVRSMADDVTALPMIAQGEAEGGPDTAMATSMLMNGANIVLRRAVKSFDDGVTTPLITRFYDWNMQNSVREDIKGDFEIDARGSSTLLVKETQSQMLMTLATLTQSPILAPMTKFAELLRKIAQSAHINPDDIIKTDDELQQEQANAQNNSPQDQLVQVQIQKLMADIDKVKAEMTAKIVEGIYSAITAAREIVVTPQVAAVADSIYKSAGGEDKNGFPLAQTPEQPMQVMPSPENTSPLFPPNPDVGMMQGMEATA